VGLTGETIWVASIVSCAGASLRACAEALKMAGTTVIKAMQRRAIAREFGFASEWIR
jgi:hypothetical protein